MLPTVLRLCALLLPLSVFSQKMPALAYLSGGPFVMGDSLHDADERPVHRVLLSPFFIGKYEVTVREFGDFVAATGYRTDAERGDGVTLGTARVGTKKPPPPGVATSRPGPCPTPRSAARWPTSVGSMRRSTATGSAAATRSYRCTSSGAIP